MTTVEILRAARALIDTPEKWTKNADGRDASGEEIVADLPSPEAVCWCAGGAISNFTDSTAPRSHAYDVLARAMGVRYPWEFNDRESTTHADVLAAFDRAIAVEEAKA